jgi:hypothetical protein
MKGLNYAIDFCESFEGRSRLELLLLPTIFVRQSTDLWVTRSRRDLQIGVAWLYWEVFYEAA